MTAAPVRILEGRCGCGAVGYAVDDAFAYAVYCHCSLCRRATGAAFKPLAGIAREKLRVSAGADDILIVGAPTWHDVRCRRCGSLLYAVVRDGTFAHVAMGTLADDPTIRPSAHIFVGSKAPWYAITDDLPQYDGHRPAAEDRAAAPTDPADSDRRAGRSAASTMSRDFAEGFRGN